jgi:hypothetical protein
VRVMARPYLGQRPFLPADRDRFWGRASEAAALARWWQDNRLTYVVRVPGRLAPQSALADPVSAVAVLSVKDSYVYTSTDLTLHVTLLPGKVSAASDATP